MNNQNRATDRLFGILSRYNGDKDNLVRDVLSDLRHWCDQYGLDYAAEDRVAYRNYVAEAADDRVKEPA